MANTGGFSHLESVFTKAASDFKEKTSNKRIEWTILINELNSLIGDVYSQNNEYAKNLTYKQRLLAQKIWISFFAALREQKKEIQFFSLSPNDCVALCEDAIKIAESKKGLLEKGFNSILKIFKHLKSYFFLSFSIEDWSELEKLANNFFYRNEDKFYPQIIDNDRFCGPLWSILTQIDEVLAEFNPKPEEPVVQKDPELPIPVLTRFQMCMGNLHGLDNPKCQKECQDMERFLRGLKYTVIWPDLTLESSTHEFHVYQDFSITSTEYTPCILKDQYVICRGELAKPAANAEEHTN